MAKKLHRGAIRSRPTSAQDEGEGAAAGPSFSPRRKGRRLRVSSQVVTDFTIQMATLSEAGIPIVRALQILEGQADPGPFKRVLADLVEDVSGGTPLSEALSKNEGVFDRLYASMVRAGETGGVLDAVLTRLARFRERAAEIRSKVSGAMIYPAIVMLVAAVVVSVMIVVVIPKFRDVFDSFGLELPRMTQILLNVSNFVVHYWYGVFGTPLALLSLHWFLIRNRPGYRYWIHSVSLKLPYIGSVIQRSMTAGFARTFGTLVQAGVPHLDALAITRDTTSNAVLARAVEDVRRTVREGETIARPMADSGVFDALTTNMVEVGEQTGELDRMLLRVADAYEVQLERRIDALFKVLEPLLLVVLATFVGFIVVALFLPMTSLMSGVNQL